MHSVEELEVSDREAELNLHNINTCLSGEFDMLSNSNESVSVVGRLKDPAEFWATSLQAPEFVSNIFNEGYRLPFGRYPCFLKNNRSSLEHPQFVQQAITKLLKDGCIEEHSPPPFCVNPLTVADSKKLRLSY